MTIISQIEKENAKKEVPDFNVGDTVRVFAKIIEGEKERLQAFEGTVIKRQGGGVRETFTVRKVVHSIGVERTFPIHSPKVDKIKVIKQGKVRRAKLYYLRDRIGSKATRIEEAVAKEQAEEAK
ncbi:50S ribosomal protein L19 [Candidatus Margulisiibacteriota bacterium]